jgi:hypothetical protein
MFGIGGAIKAIVALIIVAVIAGGIWYVTGLRADLAVSEANSAKLQEGIQQQQALMEQMREDIATIQKTNAELSAQNERQKKDVESLSKKFDKRDFGALAAEKPEVIEKLVNRGTSNVLRCLELASGAPLNDKEKSAKTPTEANRECPSLIDSDYTAPTR